MRRVLVVLALVILFILSGTNLVSAQEMQPQPDRMSIIEIRAFTDLAAAGDIAIVFRWLIDYSGSYTDNYSNLNPASVTIAFILYDIDGTTTLGHARPYVFTPFRTNGYQYGMSYFYIPASAGVMPGKAFEIRITQSPNHFSIPTGASRTMSNADWEDSTQDDMYLWFIQACDHLTSAYPNVDLKTSTDIGLVLSTYGESYFRAAIPGIQMLCPKLFYVQNYWPVETDNPYDTTLQAVYSARLQGSEFKRGADRLGSLFGVSGYFVLGFIMLIGCLGVSIYTHHKGWGPEPGMIGMAIVCTAGAVVIGNLAFTVIMIATLMATILLMFALVGRRA